MVFFFFFFFFGGGVLLFCFVFCFFFGGGGICLVWFGLVFVLIHKSNIWIFGRNSSVGSVLGSLFQTASLAQ